jgi:hypothetical protein
MTPRRPYLTDLSDAEFACLDPLLPPPSGVGQGCDTVRRRRRCLRPAVGGGAVGNSARAGADWTPAGIRTAAWHQAVRAVGAALGLEAPRVNALARQVPLLSSPAAIEQIMTHGPELGSSDSPHSEPSKTILSVAAKLEGLPHRQGAHPSAYTFSFFARSVLDWLPAQWVGADRPGRGRSFGAARPLAVVAQERATAPLLAHPGSVSPNQQVSAMFDVGDADADRASASTAAAMLGDGPVLAWQFDKLDLEALGLNRLDISLSPALGSTAIAGAHGGLEPATAAAAWRLLEAGDTLCIGQVESLGMRQLMRRARASCAISTARVWLS